MRVLITGAAGFLGSHLADRFINDGHDVIGVDNYYTGTRKNIEHLISNPRFEMIRHDVTFPLYLEVDAILNFACPASPVHYQHDPVKTLKTSVNGAINMLGLAKRTGARILQASTSEVYGDPTQHPQQESYWGNVNHLGQEPATTRANVLQKLYSLITTGNTKSISELSGSSIHMDLEWQSMTDAL